MNISGASNSSHVNAFAPEASSPMTGDASGDSNIARALAVQQKGFDEMMAVREVTNSINAAKEAR